MKKKKKKIRKKAASLKYFKSYWEEKLGHEVSWYHAWRFWLDSFIKTHFGAETIPHSLIKFNRAKMGIKDGFTKGSMKGKAKMPFNIYEKGEVTYYEHLKKWNWIHFVVKYRFMVPILRVFSRLFRGYLIKNGDIPDEPHNRFLRCFDDSFELAIRNWCVLSLREHKFDTKGFKFWAEERPYTSSADFLRMMKEMTMTMVWNDTAYREFLNNLMFSIYLNMQEMVIKDKGLDHLILTSAVKPIHYYKMYPAVAAIGKLREEEKFRVEPVYDNEEDQKKHDDKMIMLVEDARKKLTKLESDIDCCFSKCPRKAKKGSNTCVEHGDMIKSAPKNDEVVG